MHEYSIVQALLDRVRAETQSRGPACRVVRLHVRIGDASGVDPGLLATAYDTFRARSLCADAPMEIRRVAVEWNCPRCGAPIAKGASLRCPTCATPARLARGDEIILDRIEMEVPDV